MSMGKELPNLLLRDSVIFISITELNKVFDYKCDINKYISDGECNVLVLVCDGKSFSANVSADQKTELYKWLNSLPVSSIAVVDNYCCGDLLELIMMCDMRLSGRDLTVQFPGDESEIFYNFEERCQLLMGKTDSADGYRSLLKTTINSDEACKLRLINRIINMDDMLNDIQDFINRIIGNKSNYHIKAIAKCFNKYKQLGINSNHELLLEEESRQCADLIVREYFKSR